MVNWALINRSCIKKYLQAFPRSTENAKIPWEVIPRPPKQFRRYSDSSNETIAPGQYFYSDPSVKVITARMKVMMSTVQKRLLHVQMKMQAIERLREHNLDSELITFLKLGE